MKAGTENLAKVAIMFALAVTAAFMAGRSLNPPRPDASGLTAGSRANGRAGARTPSAVQLELAKLDESTEYGGNGRNIFRKLESFKPRPPQPPQPPKEQEQPQVSLPSIGLKFFGFAIRIGHAMRVFLTEGDEVFIASEGEIVNRRYRVVRIAPDSVEIEDVLTNRTESLPLRQG